MKDRNKNRQGYRKTAVGWIPEDWKCVAAGNLFDIQLGKMLNKKARKGENPMPYLANYNVRWGEFDLSEVQQMDFYEKEMYKFQLQYGDLLVCEGGEVGRCAIWEEQIKPCYFQKALHRVRASNDNVDIHFIMHFINHAATSPKMVFFVGGSGISHFTREQFKKFPIALPPLPEQKKIAEILSTWDTAIHRARKLITAKENRKKSLMQQLFKGASIREGGEKALPLKALISPVSRPVPKPSTPYLAIGLRSHGKGTFQRTVEEPYKVAMDTLYRIEKDDIIVNITFAWEGAIAIANGGDEGGLVSHRFPTFRVKENADLSFLRQLFLTKRFVWDMGLISPGGAGRNRVLSKTDFLDLKVYAPPKRAQQKIGQILSSADKEIELLEEELTTLEKQKHGLMQKLLTGEVRVKV
jgi:type I restriction enzyme S subunit